MAEELDGVLDEMNRLSISILASRRIKDILLDIPRGGQDNYFLTHPATRYEVLDLLLSYTALKPLGAASPWSRTTEISSTSPTSRTRWPSPSPRSRT